MKKITISLLGFSMVTMSAQVGINTDAPNIKSVLDIVSKNNNTGVLFPRLTTAQRNDIAPATNDSAVDGLWIYNTDSKCYEFWNSTKWVSLCNDNTDIPPLSGVKLLSYEQDPTFTFATPVFSDFFNSWDNFGPFPSSTIRTDGSSLVPEKVSYTNFSSVNFQNYNIIGVSYRPGLDLTTAEVNALITFANTPGKHLYFFTENFDQTNKMALLSNLIGDITLASTDFTTTVGTNGDNGGISYYLTNNPDNTPFVNGDFGQLTYGVDRFVDHNSTSNSFRYSKLSQSSNIQIISANNFDLSGQPQSTSKVGVFKIKNKNVFVITDGAPFYGGTTSSGPACMTPSEFNGLRGRRPLKCTSSATNGTDSGVGILMANIIAWSLKHL